jgi:hypothetical protein
MKKVKKAQVGVKKIQTATIKKSAPAAPKVAPKVAPAKEKSWFQKAKDYLDRAVEANRQVDSAALSHQMKILEGIGGKKGPAKPVVKQKSGGKVKKAKSGASLKSGGKMSKCKYGCK